MSALLRLVFNHSFQASSIDALILHYIGHNCSNPDLGLFFFSALLRFIFTYFFVVSSINTLTGQSVGLNLSAPDLGPGLVTFASSYFHLIYSCELDQRRPFLPESIGINGSAPDFEFFSCQLLVALFLLSIFI